MIYRAQRSANHFMNAILPRAHLCLPNEMRTNPGYTTCNVVLPQLQSRVVTENVNINTNFPGHIQ